MMKFLRTIFEDELQIKLDGGGDIVFPGETKLTPVEILASDHKAYDHEYGTWLNDDWLPRQLDQLDAVLLLHANTKRFSDLCSCFESDYVVPFIGSGVSRPSGLPLWSDFLRLIREFSTTSVAQLEEMLSASAFEEAADLLAKTMPTRLFDERIEHDLRVEDPSAIRGPVWLLPSLFPNLVLTLNLDRILEHVYTTEQQPLTVFSGAEVGRFRQRAQRDSYLLKLHGDHQTKAGRVLGRAEYDAVYLNGSVVAEELSLIYRTRPLLFLGCSLGPDRVVQHIANVANSDTNTPKHFAFLSIPKAEGDRLNREHFLTDRGIFPIWYEGDHSACIQALLVGMLKRAGRL